MIYKYDGGKNVSAIAHELGFCYERCCSHCYNGWLNIIPQYYCSTSFEYLIFMQCEVKTSKTVDSRSGSILGD
jgi:hypothetical protein